MEKQSQESPIPLETETSEQYKQRFHLSSLEILFGSLILLGLLYVGYFIFFQDSGRPSSKLEKKLKSLETSSQEQTKQFLSYQVQMEARVKGLEKANQDLLAQIKRMEKQLGEEKKISRRKKNTR